VADFAAISAVKLQIADEAEELGFDDTIIGTMLDSGLTETKTILAVWRGIAAKSAAVEDVSESGSSRTTRLFDRAAQMITIWQSRADAEALAAGTLERQRFASHKMVRP
jgi:uncharacterized protein with ATP-grasp and redox domains